MHAPPTETLRAHSVAEAFLYVSLAYCPACKRRPIAARSDLRRAASPETGWRLKVTCAGCGEPSDLVFHIDPPPTSTEIACINPTDEPSHIIDMAGWLSLFRVIVEGAAGMTKKSDARLVTMEAVQCLSEALRFIPVGEELPSIQAFFTQASAERFREHPELFSRSRLIGLKGKLPVAAGGNRPARTHAKKRPWWKVW